MCLVDIFEIFYIKVLYIWMYKMYMNNEVMIQMLKIEKFLWFIQYDLLILQRFQ